MQCWQCEARAIYYCCWNTAYCSVECQHAHWSQHKKYCRRKKQATTWKIWNWNWEKFGEHGKNQFSPPFLSLLSKLQIFWFDDNFLLFRCKLPFVVWRCLLHLFEYCRIIFRAFLLIEEEICGLYFRTLIFWSYKVCLKHHIIRVVLLFLFFDILNTVNFRFHINWNIKKEETVFSK